ncbi:SPFH domain-containing protein [Mycoplasma anserisalpingitidis]|uniref:SPFH domain-containing protein n=1 Tax=Mycoplasma anserisalpingitidis TaxID=519450 RepID=UPI001CF6D9D6|nr:SPFH domain-containing protein [Mycoplasma anserisalpingitidis]UCU26686.1 SPFH/Band 7/PHB domain protein [Mycoplasma anserisalpingitidis]UCU27524.1 SPFH/Band 7/PHB domain protein [Mycoplasma anserisalpingitidis]
MNPTYTALLVLVIVIIVLILLALSLTIKIVPQTSFYVIERFGVYKKVWNSGIHVKIPFIDRVALKGNYKEKVSDYEPQDVITKDNVLITVDTVVFYQITDAKLYTYGAENPNLALEKLSATTLRNLLGELDLDHTLTSREIVNNKLTSILDEASDAWGIKVNRVEVKNITPPKDVQKAMEKQMQAEREKRANILEAEGRKEASIKIAEGRSKALILEAEAHKEAKILKAQAEREAIELITSAKITPEYLKYQSIEGLKTLADGNATKIIIPPNLADIASTMSVAAEMFNDSKVEKVEK